MENLSNIGYEPQINTSENGNQLSRRAFLIGVLAGGASLMSACVNIEIPEDCAIPSRDARGVANTILESGLGVENAQAAVNRACSK